LRGCGKLSRLPVQREAEKQMFDPGGDDV
jgi:hypothetical protein